MSEQLTHIEHELAEIKVMLRKLLNPVESMGTRQKADAVLKALATGDRKHYRDVVKQINGERP